jgi:hypothetical protein
MKNRNVWIAAFTAVLMIAGLAGPNVFMRVEATTANSLAVSAIPEPAAPKADLSGKVAKFYPPDFAPITKKGVVTTLLFTPDELRKLGGNRITQVGGKFFVTTKKIDPSTRKAKVVPIEDYVAQLNDYEMFLNKLGYSLRSGPPNLGKILTLVKNRPTSGPGGDRRLEKRFFFDPTIYERTGAVRGAKIYPENIRINTSQPGVLNSQQLQAARIKATAPREILLPNGSAGSGTRVLKTEAVCPCITCGSSASPVPPASSLNPICLNGLCPSKDGLSCVKCSGGAPTPAINSSTSLGQFCGEKSKVCKASKCLYDGYLAGQWTGLSKCISATDGNDWFDASLCLDLSASSCGTNKKLNFRNGGSLHSELKIFGFSIPILDVLAAASYTDGKELKESEFKFLGETVQTFKFVQDIPGPAAIFPIGPIPVTISSGLHFEFGAGQPDFTFPSNLNPSACNGSETLNVGVGLNLNSFIKLEAYVDAFVARVGVEGQLTLADDYVGVGIKSLITPANNEVLVTPGLQYRLKHLAGKLFLFAEIDVIVYSKRFEVQIFDFDSGLGTNGQVVTEPFTQKSFGAVDQSPIQ